MNNIEFVEKLKDIANNYKTLYVMGCFGANMTEKNKDRYTKNHKYNMKESRKKMIMAADENTFGFDCVCLIKSLLWGFSGDKTKSYGGAVYKSNNVPDINADSMINVCNNISTDFSKIEVGEALWLKGHIGVYIGDGLAVECTPSWKNCVQITAVNQDKSGYNKRLWTKHGYLPYVTYEVKRELSLSEIAQKVINGEYGNGNIRKEKLESEGYNYRTVQDEVNRILKNKNIEEVAKKVINGDYGNGNLRKEKLEKEGYNYRTVQDKVNELLGVRKS